MAEEPDVIREQIEETRSSLTEKLETLEEQVRGTVQSAKASVEDTIDTVKSSVQHTVTSVKQTFDLKYQVERHPWTMLGGSFLTGFVLGNYVQGRREEQLHGVGGAVYPAAAPEQTRSSLASEDYSGYRPKGSWPESAPAQAPTARAAQPGFLSRLLGTFDDEIEKVKEVAIGAAMGVVRDLAKQSFPMLSPQIDEVMNSATAKLGGQLITGPLVPPDEGREGFGMEEATGRSRTWH